ncbi:MAG: DUF2281 domain-containing protein [Clostridium sp.]|jgi:hypothetical protein CLOSPO_02614|nr:DUF2281 domain-containing protein [Clostridium sp.]
MSLTKQLLEIIKDMPPEKLIEIIDFAENIKENDFKETKNIVDSLIEEYDKALRELAR